MADPAIYFDASYGGIPLLIARISTEEGRDVVTQSPARGDKHVRQDRGLKPLDTMVEILFCDQPGKDVYTKRFDQFRAMANGDGAQVFSHPIIGSYSARISDFSHEVDANELSIRVSCKVLAEDEPQFTLSVGAGVTPDAGLEAVSVASENATNALSAAGLSSTVPADCLSRVTDWVQGTDLDSQQVFAEVASLTSAIAFAIDTLELASNVNSWAAYQAMVLLSYQVSRAAQAATSNATQVFDLTVVTPRPLLAICADIYGSALAIDRADAIAAMNRVRTPGRVPAGTVLKMITAGATP